MKPCSTCIPEGGTPSWACFVFNQSKLSLLYYPNAVVGTKVYLVSIWHNTLDDVLVQVFCQTPVLGYANYLRNFSIGQDRCGQFMSGRNTLYPKFLDLILFLDSKYLGWLKKSSTQSICKQNYFIWEKKVLYFFRPPPSLATQMSIFPTPTLICVHFYSPILICFCYQIF